MNQYRPQGFSLLPPVVKNLLIINVLFFIATYTFQHVYNKDLSEYLGLYFFKSEYFRPWQYITHLFMHGSFTHLLFNMFALWMFGYVIENYWGAKRFLAYYLITGLGAAVLHTLIGWITIAGLNNDLLTFQNAPSPSSFLAIVNDHFAGAKERVLPFVNEWSRNISDPQYANYAVGILKEGIRARMNVPTVGASGAVFGVLLAFGMLFPNAVIYLYFAIPMKAKYLVILYGGLELYLGVMNEPGDNVAHFAHLGGMLFGFVMIMLWKKQKHF
jgi:membrane associated rhomboid family serine protease